MLSWLCLSIPDLSFPALPSFYLIQLPGHAETGEFGRFPDTSAGDETTYDYFTADFNFLAIPGKLLVGAA